MKLIVVVLLGIVLLVNCLVWLVAIITSLLLLPTKGDQNAN